MKALLLELLNNNEVWWVFSIKQRSLDIRHRSQDAEPGDRAGISGDCYIPVREPEEKGQGGPPRSTHVDHNCPRKGAGSHGSIAEGRAESQKPRPRAPNPRPTSSKGSYESQNLGTLPLQNTPHTAKLRRWRNGVGEVGSEPSQQLR